MEYGRCYIMYDMFILNHTYDVTYNITVCGIIETVISFDYEDDFIETMIS
jgi:hypothetical protein